MNQKKNNNQNQNQNQKWNYNAHNSSQESSCESSRTFIRETGRQTGNTSDKDGAFRLLPCLDSPEMAEDCRKRLSIPRYEAASLGRSAVEIAEKGWYQTEKGGKVDIKEQVQAACEGKLSIRPEDKLPSAEEVSEEAFEEVSKESSKGSSEKASKKSPEKASETSGGMKQTRIQVVNNTTLRAAFRLSSESVNLQSSKQEFQQQGRRSLKKVCALNFANGFHPGGGFLQGARAQEEVLCRSSALYITLKGDPMYEYHTHRQLPDSTDWLIYSPGVPVFRTDDGRNLDQPWTLDFITCAAPYAPGTGIQRSAELLRHRMKRLLEAAQALGCDSLVLGAWGCGAFQNDPRQTALDFRRTLEDDFKAVFTDIIFAVADWSAERRFLGPFCEVFS